VLDRARAEISMNRTTRAFALSIAAATLLSARMGSAQEASEAADDEACGSGCCDCDAIFRGSTLGFGMGVGISNIAEMDAVNARLARAGASELDAYAPYLSLSVPVSLKRLVVLTEVRLATLGGSDDSSGLDTVHATMAVGYSLTSPETLALYPFVGLGLGAATLSVGRAGPLAPSFDRALTQSSGPLELRTLAFLGTVGIGGELLIARTEDHPTRGLFAAARTGLTVSFVSSDWSMGDVGSLSDGPRAPLSGFFGELAFGLRL
jgi:hypothetical protein